MNLSSSDAELFFKLFFALLAYTNRQLHVVKKVVSAEDVAAKGSAQSVKIRNALYEHSELIAKFVAENPEGFTPEELNIVAGWQHRVSGEMYLMRYLKKYAVFLSAEPAEHLYGVLGLYSSFDEMIGGQPLPLLFKITLLPFKGQVIYDGLLEGFSILFGAGIRRELTSLYNRLKDREGIIEQLLDADSTPQIRTSFKTRDSKPAPDWKPTLDEIVAQTNKMKDADTPQQSAALALLRASAHLAQACFTDAGEVDGKLKQVRRALTRLENVLFEENF